MMVPLMPDATSFGASGSFPVMSGTTGVMVPGASVSSGSGTSQLVPGSGLSTGIPGGSGGAAIPPDCYVDQG